MLTSRLTVGVEIEMELSAPGQLTLPDLSSIS